MSLRDQACYTLELHQSPSDPAVLELVEVEGSKRESRYARVREGVQGEAYSAAVFDYMTGAKLASVGYETDRVKRRRLLLHGPDEEIPFDFSGKINFEWTFQFQGHKFRWNREVYGKDYVCSMDRKPDPKVEICLARGTDKGEPGRVQILHYNIERFPDEITDLRGLETLLVTSFMCFIDVQDERWRVQPARPAAAPSGAVVSAGESKELPPAPTPKEEKVLSEEDFEPENPNEILVGMQSNVDDHIARACGLLMDPSVMFVVIRTRKAEAAQRALEVSLGVTRFRHREGMGDLHQYVVEENVAPPAAVQKEPKGPKIISLDDPKPEPQPERRKSKSGLNKKPEWTPPPNIAIYLSTIELPDLHPSRRRQSNGAAVPAPTAPVQVKPAVCPPTTTSPPGAKLNKKPTKGFSNPFASSSSGPSKTSSASTPSAEANKTNNAPPSNSSLRPDKPSAPSRPTSTGSTTARPHPPPNRATASPNPANGMPGAFEPAPRPPSPLPPASGAAAAGAAGAGQEGKGGLSALARLIQISKK